MFNQASDVKDQARVITDTWRTYVIKGDIYLVCVLPGTEKIRITTPVQISDPAKQEFVTESGRVYQCDGPMSPNLQSFRMSLFLHGYIDDVDSFTGNPDSVN